MRLVPGQVMPASTEALNRRPAKLADNEKAILAVGRLLRKHGIVYRDIEIGRSAERAATFVIVTLENRQKVVGELEIVDRAYTDFGASVVKTEDTFIAKCHMMR